MKRASAAMWIAATCTVAMAAQGLGTGPAPAPVQIRTAVDRTAAWVGDRVTYTVEVVTAPNVEVLLEDLTAERLRLSALEVIDAATERDTSTPGTTIHRIRYTLTSYASGVSEGTIAPAPVRYSVRRPEQRPGEPLAAGEAIVPALKIALRSTIPENDPSLGLRDRRPERPVPPRITLARPVGLGLMALAVLPVALWVANVARRVYASRQRPRIRPLTRRERRRRLDELRLLDVTEEGPRRDAYRRLDAFLREHLEVTSGVRVSALTAAEVAHAPLRRIAADRAAEVLAECERAKFAQHPPPSDAWPRTLDTTEDLVRS